MMGTDADNGPDLAPRSEGEAEPLAEEIRRVTSTAPDDDVEGTPEATAAPAEVAPGATPPPPARQALGGTRASAVWTATAVAIVVLVLLAIFIAQNTRDVEVRYFTASGQAPLSVALLLATVLGMLVVLLAGAARILQLRVRARRASRNANDPPRAGRFGHRHQA
jgi:uncharacterized integral membrane protein